MILSGVIGFVGGFIVGYCIGIRKNKPGAVIINGKMVGDLRGVTLSMDDVPASPSADPHVFKDSCSGSYAVPVEYQPPSGG